MWEDILHSAHKRYSGGVFTFMLTLSVPDEDYSSNIVRIKLDIYVFISRSKFSFQFASTSTCAHVSNITVSLSTYQAPSNIWCTHQRCLVCPMRVWTGSQVNLKKTFDCVNVVNVTQTFHNLSTSLLLTANRYTGSITYRCYACLLKILVRQLFCIVKCRILH